MCPCVWHSCLIGIRVVMWRAENIMNNHYTPPISAPLHRIPLCLVSALIVLVCSWPSTFTDRHDCAVRIRFWFQPFRAGLWSDSNNSHNVLFGKAYFGALHTPMLSEKAQKLFSLSCGISFPPALRQIYGCLSQTFIMLRHSPHR